MERITRAADLIETRSREAVRTRNSLVARLERHQVHWTIVGIAAAVNVLFGLVMVVKSAVGGQVGNLIGGIAITAISAFITWSGYVRRGQ